MLKHYIAVILVSTAALAQPAYAQTDGQPITAARAAAIHECSVLASRYPETTYASLEYELYRACMARHGQVE